MARLPNQFGGAAPWPGQTGRAGQIPTTRAPKQAGGFYGGAGQAATTRAPSFYGGLGRSGGQAGGGMPQQMGAPMGFAGGQRPRPLPRPIGGNQGGGMGQNLLATGGALGNMATPDEINEARARQGKAPLPSSFWGDRGGVFLFQKPGPGGGGGVRPLWDPINDGGRPQPGPGGGGGDIWSDSRNNPNRIFSGADTQNAINAFAAKAFAGSPYGKDLPPGQSAGLGLLGSMAPQIGRIGAAINTASTSIPMMDRLANQQYQLANEQLAGQTALGQAGLSGGLYDMIMEDRNAKLRDLLGLLGGLYA